MTVGEILNKVEITGLAVGGPILVIGLITRFGVAEWIGSGLLGLALIAAGVNFIGYLCAKQPFDLFP